MPKTPMTLPAPTDISALRDRYLSKNRKKHSQRRFYSEVAGIFAAYPDVQKISFVFYTPWGFNDGDPQTPNFYSSVNGHGYCTVLRDGTVKDKDIAEDYESTDFLNAFDAQDEYDDFYGYYCEVYSKKETGSNVVGQLPEVKEAAKIAGAMRHTVDEALGEGIALRFDRINGIPVLTHKGSYDAEY